MEQAAVIEKKKRKLGVNAAAMIIVTLLSVIANIIAWVSPRATDFYHKYIFSWVSELFSSLIGVIPFSFGEVLIVIGIALVIIAPVLFIAAGVMKKKRLLKISAVFYCWVLIYILVTETYNCFVLYHTTEFSARYHASAGAEGFTVEQLITLCEETIEKVNENAALVARDEEGNMIVPDDLPFLAEEAFNRMSERYDLFKGKNPPPKKMMFSMLMTQFDLQGIYFPFTLEANYNEKLAPARVPCTVVHELAHVKGFIREDEAGFIASIVCANSESPELRYSGYISAMNYLFGAVKKNASYDEYIRLANLIDLQVFEDNYFVSEEYLKEVEEKSVVSTETASVVSEKAMDTTLKIGGVTDGKKSYNRMVDLLLEYRYYIQE